MLEFLKKTKRRMLISALISGLNRTFWASVVVGLLFFSFDIPAARISFVLFWFGSVFVFLVLPFFRQLSYRELLVRFLDTVPDLPPHANRIFTAALDFEMYPGTDSSELRSRAVRDAEKLLEPLDPYCVVPFRRERIGTVVSLLLMCGLLWFVVCGQRTEDRGQRTVTQAEKKTQIEVFPQPPLPDGRGSDDTPPLPDSDRPTLKSRQDVVVEQQLSLFLRTKKEFLSLLGKSQSRLTQEKRQLLDAMSQRQRTISFNQEDAIKEQMLENADHFSANRLGQSLELQREILLALGCDPDLDYEKDGVTPFVPESLFHVPAAEPTQYEALSSNENSPGSENIPGNDDATNSSQNHRAGSQASQGTGSGNPNEYQTDLGTPEIRYSGLWGELPGNERQIGQQVSREQVLPEYQIAVDRYYRTLFHAAE